MTKAAVSTKTQVEPGGSVAERRAEIDRLIAEGAAQPASAALSLLWAREGSAVIAPFVVSRFERLRAALDLVRCRVAILRSFTVEPLVPVLRAGGFAAGIDLSVSTSAFNAHAQEILEADSALYAFEPDVVILAVQTRDVAPEIWGEFADLDSAVVDSIVSRVTTELRGWIAAFRARSRAHLVIHNLEEPAIPSRGILDAQQPSGQADAVRRINSDLQAMAAGQPGVYVLDYDALVAKHGRVAWHDERKWLTVRLPIAAQHLPALTAEWLRFLHPLAGRVAKAVVVDLDNTLWGGVVGEDGVDRLQLGAEYPGAAYRDVQRALLDLKRRGILLAVCSKNNPEDATEALQRHPGMLLRLSDFASTRINWSDKAENLRDIARELNIGVDALAFVDDNPIEREHVRRQLPDVHVLELPDDPMHYGRALRESPLFERLAVSDEDARRAEMYGAQRDRDALMQAAGSKEDFYRSLQQEAVVVPLSPASLPRMSQLTNKTNQFNLTTRRYTEQQMSEAASTPGWSCFGLRLRDRFGDNGLVGVAVVRTAGGVCDIDSFLLSCRVIGRTVETAFLSFLAQHAKEGGAQRLQGWFRPTKKNAPAREFYPAHGFSVLETTEHGTLWGLDLAGAPLACPEWIALTMESEGRR